MRAAPRRRPDRTRPAIERLERRDVPSASGTLDATFGGGKGYVEVPLGLTPTANTSSTVTVLSAAAQAGGQFLVEAAIAQQSLSGPSGNRRVLVEFKADGSFNGSFAGGGGSVPLNDNFRFALQPSDGKIIAYGPTTDGGGNATYEAIRLNPDGTIDTTYGTNGFAMYPASTPTPPAMRLGNPVAAAFEPDGRLVLVGPSVASAVRLNLDGSIDTTFGQSGTANPSVTIPNAFMPGGQPANTTVVGAETQADGKILLVANVRTGVASGNSGTMFTQEIAAIRLNTDGSLDTSYGSNGVVELTADPSNPTARGVAIASGVAILPGTGDLIISGTDTLIDPSNPPATNLLIALSPSGSLDASFAGGGRTTTAFSGPLVVQPLDNKLLVASRNAIERFLPDGSADLAFGNPLTPGVAFVSSKIGAITALAAPTAGGSIVAVGNGSTPSPVGPNLGLAVAGIKGTSDASAPATGPPRANPASIDSSGLTLPAFFQPLAGTFNFGYDTGAVASGQPSKTIAFGPSGTGQAIPVAADFLGMGSDQIAVYIPLTGTYLIKTIGSGLTQQFGTAGAGKSIPAPADYEGTGRDDIAVYLADQGAFAIRPSDGSPGRIVPFGSSGAGRSIPVPADYYGTGRDDVAVYLTGPGAFAIQDPTGKTAGRLVYFGPAGQGNSIPVPGDYDGSGKVEFAVYVPSQGAFYFRPAKGGPDVKVPFGTPSSGEVPVVGDYDNSGRSEFAVFDASRGFLAYRPALGGNDMVLPITVPTGGLIPLAEPIITLPNFNPGGIQGGGQGIAPLVVATPPTQAPAPTPAAARAPVVPQGPTFAPARATRPVVNQAASDRPSWLD